jgi:alkylated DNA repair protein (DNA oxidative demethylase)
MSPPDLFDTESLPSREHLGPGSLLLRGFALPHEDRLLAEVNAVIAAAPFRHMVTRSGYGMSVAMSNCGQLGWVTDRQGYRYSPFDPATGRSWPTMPETFITLASLAASEAGYADFRPDACLINRYEPGSKMGLHQDKDERDFTQPIVSISLGLPAVFLFGGLHRSDKAARIRLKHGDILVWGGADRLRYHGILPITSGGHSLDRNALLDAARINLTFRKAA